jgi:lipid-binding SYLF domain-containing protein
MRLRIEPGEIHMKSVPISVLQKSFFPIVIILAICLLAGCSTTRGKSGEEKRQAIQRMKQETLAGLYEKKPDVQAQIAKAPGYAVFSNANVYIIAVGLGGGYGVVENNQGGNSVYMKMGEVGVGFGVGVKDYRIVMVFHTIQALEYFVTHGWSLGGQADAAAKAGDLGGAVGGEGIVNNVTVYQITESGLALQATIKGTKFWPDGSLN